MRFGFSFLKFNKTFFYGSRAGLVICIQSASIILLGVGAHRFSSVVRDSSNGAVAQLGERLICIQEVAGSIPTSSTNLTGAQSVFSALCAVSKWACSSVG